MRQEQRQAIVMLGLIVVLASFIMVFKMARAEPEGAGVTYVSNTTKNASAPDFRTDAKGTITTVLLTTVQQNIKWKAYVGNVSGTLVLRDADSFTLYQWPTGGSPDGKVYMTINNTIDWSTIQCANDSQVISLQTALGFLPTAVDNINNTFSNKIHENFDVGVIPIAGSSCKSTATWINNSQQTLTPTSLFQEVLLMDLSSRIVFTTLIDQNVKGFNNKTYDFQALVPDYSTAAVATYYFYLEISG